MDPRKQKRLGPAPIASFEKSFEDTTTISLTSSFSQQQVAAINAPTIGSAITTTTTTLDETSSILQENTMVQEEKKEEKQGIEITRHLPANINQQVNDAQAIAKEFYGNGGDENGDGVLQELVS